MLGNLQEMIGRYPNAFACWLQCLHFLLGPVQEVALVWPSDQPAPQDFLRLLRHTYVPLSVQAAAPLPLPQGVPALLEARLAVADQPTVYLCENFTCKSPLTRLEEFQLIWLHPPVGQVIGGTRAEPH